MYPERSKPQPQLHFAFTDDRSTISFSTRLLPQVKSPPPARLDFGFLFGVTFALVTLRSRVAWHYYHVYMYTGDTVVWEIETTPAVAILPAQSIRRKSNWYCRNLPPFMRWELALGRRQQRGDGRLPKQNLQTPIRKSEPALLS